MFRLMVAFGLLLIAGCATAPHPTSESPTGPGNRYEAEAGRDSAAVARMRAAPAPATPMLDAGRSRSGDRNRLAGEGFALIGTGYFHAADIDRGEIDVRKAAIEQGQRVGAERVLLYAPSSDVASEQWIATFYVRFQLPFGATFRDLRESERRILSRSGVQIGSVIDGTPASRANLLSGDFLVAIDGASIAGKTGLQEALKQKAGRKITLTIVRNGETLQRALTLGTFAVSAQR